MVGTSLPVTHSYQSRIVTRSDQSLTTEKSVAQRSFRHPPASGGERHDRAPGTAEEADDKSVEADLHGERGGSARFLRFLPDRVRHCGADQAMVADLLGGRRNSA